MKISELLSRERSEQIGIIWRTTAPPGVVNYHGTLLELVSNGLYSVSLRISTARGRAEADYNPLQPGETLNLHFGSQADIEFYNDKSEGHRLYRAAMRRVRKTFGKETVDGLKEFRLE